MTYSLSSFIPSKNPPKPVNTMGDGLGTLLLLGGIMAASSFIAGILPLSLSLSQRQLRIMTALGSGILVGTALIVIIPEGIEAIYSHEEPHSKRSEHHDHDTESSSHAIIGFTLAFGFLLMYLIDVLPNLLTSSTSKSESLPMSSLGPPTPTTPSKPTGNHAHATTIGLVIHSFADGIALGASSSTPSSVGLIVFFAIMLHKAPAAFGLTTTLLKQGLGRREARSHLLAFSLAAPVGAIVTWMIVKGLTSSEVGGQGAGVALVFSGGTFLYVAMHALSGGEQTGQQLTDVMYTAAGMMLPLVTQIGHAHAHAH